MKISGVKMTNGWTTDCGGTQDLDFPILRVSTRYYPDFSSSPSFLFGHDDEYEVILEHDGYIWGDSESECKIKTEKWIKDNVNKAISILLDRLNKAP